ncbi:hypothetical protein TorRG33x02_170410 [Trema orientale]|uniref:Glabrous enhancer-binding protein-like DBD domain-containing protein n=1 Tax=Trema orientale TaxID=63057 RepID=A0A2P5ENL4_TREOI|nr:hypothetical protein TorRG33x02_170410 [Trema orientale]
MAWPLVRWIMSSSSSPSSSSSFSASEFDDDDDVEFNETEDQESPTNDVVSRDQPEYDDDGVDSVTVAVTGTADPSSSTSKRRRTDENYDDAATTVRLAEKKKRVWTAEDEIELLQSFLDYTASRRTGPHQKTASNSFYSDRIKPELRLRFNKTQLVEKLRRLKRKYENNSTKMKGSGVDFRFRSPHEKGIFEISQKIWSGGGGGSVVDHEDVMDDNTGVAEKSRPRTRSQTRNSSGGSMRSAKRGVLDCDESDTTGLVMGLALKPMSFELKLGEGDEKWREQQIMELEVYSKRLELVQSRVKAALDKLRSSPTEADVLRT